MRLAPQTLSPTTNFVTAYRMTLGSRKARETGLVLRDGTRRDFLIVPTKSYIMLLTIEESMHSLSYRNCSTTIYRHGNIYFGEVTGLPSSPTWYTTSLESAEKSFHSVVDSYFSPSDN